MARARCQRPAHRSRRHLVSERRVLRAHDRRRRTRRRHDRPGVPHAAAPRLGCDDVRVRSIRAEADGRPLDVHRPELEPRGELASADLGRGRPNGGSAARLPRTARPPRASLDCRLVAGRQVGSLLRRSLQLRVHRRGRAAAAVGPGRGGIRRHDRSASAPRWRARNLSRDATQSWVSPACAADGERIVAAAGPNRTENRFGEERRSVWVLAADGSSRKRLTSPPPGATDESPRWSSDGRWILFVRSNRTTRNATAFGSLYLLEVATRRLRGPLARVGPAGNYYGLYGWPSVAAWFQPGS